MPSLIVEPLRAVSSRDARRLQRTRRQAEDVLAGRTVWCVAALPGGRDAAVALRTRLEIGSDEGTVAVGCLEVSATGPLEALGERLETTAPKLSRLVARP